MWEFDQYTAATLLYQQFQEKTIINEFDITLAIRAVCCLFQYAEYTKKSALPHIHFQNATAPLLEKKDITLTFTESLQHMGDLERIVSRIILLSARGGGHPAL